MTIDRHVLSGLATSDPADAASIAQVEAFLGSALPKTYVEFLQLSNGAEGGIGDTYVELWPVDKLAEENVIAAEFLTGFILFGSDGGGEAFAFDLRVAGGAPVVQVPFVTLDVEDVEQVGHDFASWLIAILEQ